MKLWIIYASYVVACTKYNSKSVTYLSVIRSSNTELVYGSIPCPDSAQRRRLPLLGKNGTYLDEVEESLRPEKHDDHLQHLYGPP